MPLRVAAIQLDLRKKPYNKLMKEVAGLVRRAANYGARIACLPEHWLLNCVNDADELIGRLREISLENKIFLVTGAEYYPIAPDRKIKKRVRSFTIGPDGEIIGHQDKVHLFGKEKTNATPGHGYQTIGTKIGNIGVAICHDNVFPEVCRTLALKGADIIFAPSMIEVEGMEPWTLYLKTRALENRIPMVAPNVFYPPRYLGKSIIIDLEEKGIGGIIVPKTSASSSKGATTLVADVNLEKARILRRVRLKERRPSSYSIQ